MVLIDLDATDLEGDDLIFQISGTPPGATFDTVTGEFRWEPPLDAGDGPEGFRIWTVLFRVIEVRDDDQEPLSDEKIVRMRVEDRNLIPKLDSTPDQQVAEGDTSSRSKGY